MLTSKLAFKCVAAGAFLISASLEANAPTSLPSEAAQEYLDHAISLLQDKHINRGNVDWPLITANAHLQIKGAQTSTDTYPAIWGILAALKEKHSYLMPPRDSVPAPPTKATASPAATPAASATMPLPRGDNLSGEIGLVWLPHLDTAGSGGELAGKAYKDTLISALKTLDVSARCGWIIDLRDNGGGNMYPMLNGLDPVLGDEPFAYFVSKAGKVPWVRSAYGIAPYAELQQGLKPSFELKHMDAPVAVLIGPRTASSGEMVALALIGRDKVKSFGAATAAFTTGNTVHPMSDGANLVITEVAVADRRGKNYTGAIMPDEVVATDIIEKSAAEWLTAQCKDQKAG